MPILYHQNETKRFFVHDFLGSGNRLSSVLRFCSNLANLTTVCCEFNCQNGDAKIINKLFKFG